MQRDETSEPQGRTRTTSSSATGQFYLIGYSHERDEVRVFRLSRIRGKVSYATKAEHDFSSPEDFDRRDYAQRADWQMGEIGGTRLGSSSASGSHGWSSATSARTATFRRAAQGRRRARAAG